MIVHDVPQGELAWFKLRAGRPTSSMFSHVITSKGERSESFRDYAEFLAVEKYLDGPAETGWKGNKFTDRGHQLEPQARADYEMERQVKVVEVGFITDDLMRWGASTDGLVGDDGIFEAKNMIDTRFFSLMRYVRKHKRMPPEYIPQVQGEIFVAERQWCDIVFWNPKFDPIIFRVEADLEYHAKLKQALLDLLAERDTILKEVA